MRREVPDDVHVALVEAEAQPGRVDVEHAAELPGTDDVPQLPDRGVVLEGVTDDQQHVVGRRSVDQCLRVFHRRGQRLLDEYVLACCQGAHRDVDVARRWRGHQHGVDPIQHVVDPLGRRLHRGVVRLRLAQPAHVAVHDGHRNVRHGAQYPDVLASPVPVADNGHVHVLSHLLPPNHWCSRTFDHMFYAPPNDVRRWWRARSSDRYFRPPGTPRSSTLSSRTRVRRFVLHAHNRSGSYPEPAPLVRSGSQCRLFRGPDRASNGRGPGAVLDLCTGCVAFRTAPPRASPHPSTD